MMTPALRKLALATHVTSSVGWIGAVLVFLAIAAVAFPSDNAQIIRGAYLVMEPAAWGVLLPLAFASLLSGLVMSLGTPWGLFRHYWVVVKLAITVFATTILLIYMGTFRLMAAAAADARIDLGAVRNPSPIVHAVLALMLLLIANVLAIYKPLGLTPYGVRQQRQAGGAMPAPASGRWERYALAAGVALLTAVVLWHIAGDGMHGHG